MAEMIYKGKGIIWDSKKDCPIANFGKTGVFKTNVAAVQKKLTELGYEAEIVQIEKDETPPNSGEVKKDETNPDPAA